MELTLVYRTFKFSVPMVFLGENGEVKFRVFQSIEAKSLFKSLVTFSIKDSGDTVLAVLTSKYEPASHIEYVITKNNEQLGGVECTVSGPRTNFNLKMGNFSYALSGAIKSFFSLIPTKYVITRNNVEIAKIEKYFWQHKYKVNILISEEITAVLCLSTALAQAVQMRSRVPAGMC